MVGRNGVSYFHALAAIFTNILFKISIEVYFTTKNA